ncbi:MAG TPA: DNA translocase FtsK 4TM domain-containing protein [Longimicrobiaceae bacterium]|nr:DNA translocase FtsK 4TM domain-containing protein [Longimicrobiaceae bacterium]
MPKRSSSSPADRLQHELWALLLLALAILLTLSFVPPRLFGAGGVRLFPTGNIVGRVGEGIAASAWAGLGIAGFLLPLFPAVWAALVLERIPRASAVRLSALGAGVLLLLPAGIYAFTRPLDVVPPSAGWLGVAIGGPLSDVFGWLGAGVLATFLFAALCVTTLGWNPLRSLAAASASLFGHARGLSGAVAGGVAARLPRPAPEGTAPEESWGADLLDEPPAPPPALDDPFGERDEETVLEEAPPAAARAPRAPKRPPARPAAPANEVVSEDTGDPESSDLPASTLLEAAPARDEAQSRRALDGLGQVLIDKLATFKIQGEIVGMTTGPVVTQFEVSPAPGVKVARIANLDADLALALKAPSVRIVAPIPGKGAVGVEVPNPEPEMVHFREVLEAPAFRGSRAQLPLALGKDIAGKPYVADLARMPHLLIAGATGSGKSVCVNTIITSLVYRHSPKTLRLLMVDPKMVELSMYNDLPHLRHPVVTDNQDAAGVLKWAVLEMERRYALLSVNNVRNLQDFNRRLESGQVVRTPEAEGEEDDPDRWIYKGGPLPYLVVIVDELADLMMTAQGDVEKPLALLAQKARAIGIHLILATQRPSVNVITGLIKANFPSRIAFRVASKVDSRTILDQNGADSLLGNGDMLFLPPGTSDPLRIQGAFLSTEETERLMAWYREQARLRREEALEKGLDPDEPAREGDILEMVRAAEGDGEALDDEEALADRDKLFREAAELCIQQQGGSTSLLQRRLRIGYGRAARIIDQLHHAGILGPPDGSKAREVLVDFVQLEQFYPED